MPKLCTRLKHLRLSSDNLNTTNWTRAFTVALCPPPDENLDLVEREYRYCLEDSPNYPGLSQDDPVLQTIIALIRELAKESVAVYGTRIRVWNLTKADSLWPPTNSNFNSRVKLYAFKEHSEEFPMTVPVSLVGRHLCKDALQVRVNGEWRSMRSWLLSFHAGPETELKWQRKWWDSNEKAFPLMKLPPEVRAVIFRHALGSLMYLRTAYIRNSLVEDLQYVRLADHKYGVGFDYGLASKPNYNILFLSKQVFKEAAQAAWVGTRKYFNDSDVFYNVTQLAKGPGGYDWLSRIELYLEFTGYLDLFGVSIHPYVRYANRQHVGRFLRRIPTLRDVSLEFPEKPYTNPWKSLYINYKDMDWFQADGRYVRMNCTDVCSKVVIDWILTLAFPFINRIPTVRLRGGTKSSMKTDWEFRLDKEYQAQRHGMRHRDYSWTRAYLDLKGWRSWMVPTCQCALPCNVEKRQELYDGMVIDWEVFDFDDEYNEKLLERAKKLYESAGTKLGIGTPWLENSSRIVLYGPSANLDELEEKWAALQAEQRKDTK